MNEEQRLSPSAVRVRRELDFGEALGYAELSRRLDLSTRQLFRAICQLREMGVPIVSEGKPLRFRIPEEDRRQAVRVVSLSDEEILALRLAAQASRSLLAPTPLVDALDSAFGRLLKEATTQSIAIDEEAERRQWHFGEAPQSDLRGDVFDALRDAVDAQRSVEIDYVTASSGTGSIGRKVDPYCIALRGGTWMLVAFCHRRQEIREFNIAGITRALPCDEERDARAFFDLPEGFDPEIYFRDRFRYLGGGEVVVVRLLVEPKQALYFRRKCYHATQQIEEEHDDGGVVVSYEVEGLEEIRSFAQSWGTAVTVIEPEELVERMRGDAVMLAERYSGGDDRRSRIEDGE